MAYHNLNQLGLHIKLNIKKQCEKSEKDLTSNTHFSFICRTAVIVREHPYKFPKFKTAFFYPAPGFP